MAKNSHFTAEYSLAVSCKETNGGEAKPKGHTCLNVFFSKCERKNKRIYNENFARPKLLSFFFQEKIQLFVTCTIQDSEIIFSHTPVESWGQISGSARIQLPWSR